ncbi:MAG: hypothetical protein HON48_01900 [Desulfobacula sp.]|nr:hypothetical protein [Desulfobacula sp.]
MISRPVDSISFNRNFKKFQPKSTIKFSFACWAMGCAPSLAISKVPDARRQGVTTEA